MQMMKLLSALRNCQAFRNISCSNFTKIHWGLCIHTKEPGNPTSTVSSADTETVSVSVQEGAGSWNPD